MKAKRSSREKNAHGERFAITHTEMSWKITNGCATPKYIPASFKGRIPKKMAGKQESDGRRLSVLEDHGETWKREKPLKLRSREAEDRGCVREKAEGNNSWEQRDEWKDRRKDDFRETRRGACVQMKSSRQTDRETFLLFEEKECIY